MFPTSPRRGLQETSLSLGDGKHTEKILRHMDKGRVDRVDGNMTNDFTRRPC